MTHIAFLLYCIVLLGIVVLAKSYDRQQTAPLVDVHKVAMPARGFVCTPAITPRIGPVRSREIVT